MPELPEAETIARQLQQRLAGRKLGKVVHVRADMVHPAGSDLERFLGGKRVAEVARRGKRVVMRLRPAGQLILRLGMSGNVGIVPARHPVEKHTHLRVRIDRGGLELRFHDPRRFGGIWIVQESEEDNLGAEPLTIGSAEFRELMRRRRQIKALLMDQAHIAGLGNIYCDESLFRAQIHPLTIASRLSGARCEALRQAIRETLEDAIAHKGSTFRSYRDVRGEKGGFQTRHNVYGREGEACPRCASTIQRIIAAGRSTFFCLQCQRRPHQR